MEFNIRERVKCKYLIFEYLIRKSLDDEIGTGIMFCAFKRLKILSLNETMKSCVLTICNQWSVVSDCFP